MNLAEYKRDVDLNSKVWRKTPNGFYALQDLSIVFPTRWRTCQLAKVDEEITCLGMFLVVSGKSYMAGHAPTIVQLDNTSIKTIMINDVPHFELTYEKGQRVITNINAVQRIKLMFYIYDEFYAKAKAPIWFDYNEQLDLFRRCKYYMGIQPNGSWLTVHLLTSLLGRWSEDPDIYFREKSTKTNANACMMIPIRSSTYGAKGVLNRMTSGYFNDRLTASLLDTVEHETAVEHIMRY